MRQSEDKSIIVIEQNLNAPSEKVWKALTDNALIKQWYFQLPDFKPEIGFEFSFEGGPEDRVYIHKCRIIEVVPGKKLAYSWRYEGYEGNTLVTFELIPDGDKTILKLSHGGIETFPPIPDFARKNFLEGWTHIIGTSLKQFVE